MGTANVTLYAKWEAATYTVNYEGNGNDGGSVPIDSGSYLNEATVSVLTNSGSLTKTGYAFSGWNTQADGDGTPPGVRLVSSRRPSGILPSSSEDEPEDDGVEERPGSFRRAGGGSRSSSQRMTRPPPIARSRPAPARPRSMTSEF
jgi:hypothetical protein